MSDSPKLSDHKTVTTDPGGTDNPLDLVLPAPAAVLFAALHRRWSLHLLYLLGQRPARFTELQRTIPGISAMSLNERLRALIDAGLIARHVSPGPPLSSIYQATPTGRLIGEHLIRMAADTQSHQPGDITTGAEQTTPPAAAPGAGDPPMPDTSFTGPQTDASADLEPVEQPPDPDDRQACDELDDYEQDQR